MLVIALQSALVLTVMETLWLVGNKPWLEEHIGAPMLRCGLALPRFADALLRAAQTLRACRRR
jgi:hypothetical protein